MAAQVQHLLKATVPSADTAPTLTTSALEPWRVAIVSCQLRQMSAPNFGLDNHRRDMESTLSTLPVGKTSLSQSVCKHSSGSRCALYHTQSVVVVSKSRWIRSREWLDVGVGKSLSSIGLSLLNAQQNNLIFAKKIRQFRMLFLYTQTLYVPNTFC